MSSAKLHALFPEGKPRGLREGLEQTYVEFCAINDREH
jgi:hypothetical protein